MTLLKVGWFFLSLSSLASCTTLRVNLAGELKCRSIEGDGLCPKLSHLEAGTTLSNDDGWAAKLSYDVAQSRKATWYDSLDWKPFDLAPRKSWLADYGIQKQFEDNRLSFAVEDTDGTTLLPDASHLAFSKNLQDIGWKQTAARLSFDHKEIFEADIILGLGEGERLTSDDSDIYYGMRARWYFSRILGLQLAYSQDKNSLNKDAIWWEASRDSARKGIEAERFATALILNGNLPFARGLEATFGFQQNKLRSDRHTSFAAPLNLAFDPTESLGQSLGAFGVTKRSTLYYSASYRILAEYILAFHGSEFQSQIGESLLISCGSLDAAGVCVGSTDKNRSFRLREHTYGVGKIDEDGWSVLLEAHEERYDRLYQNFHFLSGRSPRQKNMRILQARIAWNW